MRISKKQIRDIMTDICIYREENYSCPRECEYCHLETSVEMNCDAEKNIKEFKQILKKHLDK